MENARVCVILLNLHFSDFRSWTRQYKWLHKRSWKNHDKMSWIVYHHDTFMSTKRHRHPRCRHLSWLTLSIYKKFFITDITRTCLKKNSNNAFVIYIVDKRIINGNVIHNNSLEQLHILSYTNSIYVYDVVRYSPWTCRNLKPWGFSRTLFRGYLWFPVYIDTLLTDWLTYLLTRWRINQ